MSSVRTSCASTEPARAAEQGLVFVVVGRIVQAVVPLQLLGGAARPALQDCTEGDQATTIVAESSTARYLVAPIMCPAAFGGDVCFILCLQITTLPPKTGIRGTMTRCETPHGCCACSLC